MYFDYCPTAGMQNGDEASLSINLAGQAFGENAQNSWSAWCISDKILYAFILLS